MRVRTILALLAIAWLPLPAYATPLIIAGSWTIDAAAGQSSDVVTLQPIAVMVSGTPPGDAFYGADLALNVQSGGPVIQLVDLTSGVFSGNNTGQVDYLSYGGSDQYSSIAANTGTVGPTGILALITFDATGVAPGTYLFQLSNFAGASDLPPFFAPILVDGAVTVVPEPATAFFLAIALVGLTARRRSLP